METYQQVVDFIEQQDDINGETIKNEIDKRDNFMSSDSYNGKGKSPIEKGGNTFFESE